MYAPSNFNDHRSPVPAGSGSGHAADRGKRDMSPSYSDGLAAMLDRHSVQGKEREPDVLGPHNATAEAAVALAIALNFYNNHATIDVDQASELKG